MAKRGEVWLANLDPTQGSEQAGTRPVIIFQNDVINPVIQTFVAIPLTTNLRRAQLPTSVLVEKGDGGLTSNSVALCNQLRVLASSRLTRKLGVISSNALQKIETSVLFTLGIVSFPPSNN